VNDDRRDALSFEHGLNVDFWDFMDFAFGAFSGIHAIRLLREDPCLYPAAVDQEATWLRR
jgi:hypothetical protein